jgi:hypothetical protein
MDLHAVRATIQRDDTFISPHALSEALADGLDIDDIWASLLDPAAEVIEDYPSDPRGPSCLMLSFVSQRPVHTVIAFPCKRYAANRQIPAIAFLITVYRPDLRPHEWDARFRTRLPQP